MNTRRRGAGCRDDLWGGHRGLFRLYGEGPRGGKIELTPKAIDLPRLFVEHKGLVLVAHGLLYFLTPQVSLDVSLGPGPGGGDLILTGQFHLTPYIPQMIQQGLPISLLCCVVVATHSAEVAWQADVMPERKRGQLKERELP